MQCTTVEQLLTINEGTVLAHFLGSDKEKLDLIANKVKRGITTQEEKNKAIAEIDELIDDSNRILTYSSFSKFLVAAGMSLITAGILEYCRIGIRLEQSNVRNAFRESLMDLRSQVKSIKVKR